MYVYIYIYIHNIYIYIFIYIYITPLPVTTANPPTLPPPCYWRVWVIGAPITEKHNQVHLVVHMVNHNDILFTGKQQRIV